MREDLMSTAIQPYENELRLLANNLVNAANAQRQIKQITAPPKKPLGRVQAYLVELKTCTVLLTDWLKEFKELIIVVSLICFFAWGVIDLIMKLHSPSY